MLLKKKISIDGNFAKVNEDINDKDIIKILDEGKIIEGNYGEQKVFKIETKNGEKILSFNQTTQNNLIDYMGEDTSKWIGKEVKVWSLKAMVSGKLRNVVYLSSPEAEMTDDGQFVIAGKQGEAKTELPTIDSDKDLPF